MLLCDNLEHAQGFYLLTLFSGLLYTATLTVAVLRHLYENGWPVALQWRDALVQAGVVVATIALLVSAFTIRAAESTYALAIGLDRIEIVKMRVNVAGAGSDQRAPFVYEFDLRWGDDL